MARLRGRAPKSGVKPFSRRNSIAASSHSTAQARLRSPRRWKTSSSSLRRISRMVSRLLKLAHIHPDHPPRRTEQILAEGLGNLGLASASGTNNQEHSLGSRGIPNPCLNHGDPVDQTFNRFGLAKDAFLKKSSQA